MLEKWSRGAWSPCDCYIHSMNNPPLISFCFRWHGKGDVCGSVWPFSSHSRSGLCFPDIPSPHPTASSVQDPHIFNEEVEEDRGSQMERWKGRKPSTKAAASDTHRSQGFQGQSWGRVLEDCSSYWYCSLGALVCKQIFLLMLGFVRADRVWWGWGWVAESVEEKGRLCPRALDHVFVVENTKTSLY